MADDGGPLGVGLSFRPRHRTELFLARGSVDLLEVVADHYMDAGPEKLAELELLAAHYPLVPHSLNLSLGSAEGLDPGYLDRLGAIVDRLDPPWWSEHVAYTRAAGIELGHLAPLPFTEEAVATVCRNVARARKRIAAPLMLENSTRPMALPGSEMSEGRFLREIVERTGCGLLLDVTNLLTNAVNHGFDPLAQLGELPLERVVQLHFAGGHRHRGRLIDSHSAPTPEEVFSLMEEVYRRAPVRAAILERDRNLPKLAELAGEVDRCRDIARRHGRLADAA